jgi:hypothetical protein
MAKFNAEKVVKEFSKGNLEEQANVLETLKSLVESALAKNLEYLKQINAKLNKTAE